VRAFISIPLAGLFVFLAAFNVWIMLTGRGASPRSRRIWTQIHRVCGYAFISLFVIFCYFMLLRIRSLDELSPRIVLHLSLAFILAPLLFVKVIVVRYQKSAWNLLITLGVTIFAVAFTLVSMNVAVHYLRDVVPHKVPFAISLRVIVATIIAAGIAFFAKAKQSKPKTPAAPPAPVGPPTKESNLRDEVLHLTLARIESQTHDAKTLRFVLPSNQQISPKPGQFLTFDWMIDGKPVKRSYTICSSPTQRNFVEITPKRVENGHVSKFLNDRATIGMTVKARGPYGKFHFDESKHKRIVLIAAGSGITPMVAMLRYIDDLCLTVDVTLIYCVRTERDLIFANELVTLSSRIPGFRYAVVLSQAGDEWKGWKGRLRREVLDREIDKPLDCMFFLCGPPSFMDLARSLVNDMGVETSRVLQESFGGGVSGEKASVTATGPLEIRLARSGLSYHMSSSGTVLENSEQNGVLIPSGCRQGNCGTCATKLLSGNVRMDNEEALTEELRVQGFILPCVSRPLSNLILDA
jgi:ferredoxin-NADP reductase